jgi:hypothetical protein
MTSRLSRMVLVLGTLVVLLTAKAAYADQIQGYPCLVSYVTSVSLGDTLDITLYTEPYCAGTYVGWSEFYSQPASGCGYGVPTSSLASPDSLRALHAMAISNYWRRMLTSRKTVTSTCGGNSMFTVAYELRAYSN